jgi:hypothetical protein
MVPRQVRDRYQAYRISAEKEEPYQEPFEVTDEEAVGWERSLNDFRSREEVASGIYFVVRRASEPDSTQ